MLNLEEIKKIDKSDMLNLLLKFPELAENALSNKEKIKLYSKPSEILVTGMGGSAIAGDLLKNWLSLELTVPILVCRNYYLPGWVSRQTLVITISYSGNTEETLAAFKDARKKRAMIICITSGGELEKLCKKLNIMCVNLPKGMPPRAALPSIFFSLVQLLRKINLINRESEIKETIQMLKKLGKEIKPSIPIEKNKAKQIAKSIKGVPIIYASTEFEGVAKRLKTQFNENSKIFSKFEVFPELCHNEVVSWSKTLPATVILVRGEESEKIKASMEFVKKFLKGKTRILELHACGKSRLARIFSLVYLGDFISFYLACLHKVDPTPVNAIKKLKAFLKRKY